MKWFFLLVAGFLEIGWVISLKYTEGFTKIIPMIFYAFFGFSSAYFFANALKSIPIGVAYSIWMGIAVIGTSIVDSFMNDKSYNPAHIFFILLIIAGIMGLKFSANTQS